MRLLIACGAIVCATGHAAMQAPSTLGLGPGTALAAAATRHVEEGRPLVRIYPPSEYGGGAQNWAIVQDARGVIYVGSGGGVQEYDGVSWRLIETPKRSTARSLAIGEDGRIYVGAVSDLGYLAPDATGTLAFVSLHDKIPPEAQRYGDVWRTFALADGVYFQADAALFRYADGAMRVWTPPARFNRSSVVDGTLHVPQPGLGLTVLENGEFRALPGTAALGSEPYPVVLRYDERRLLVGSRLDGLFLYDGQALIPFRSEVDDLIRGSLYRGLVMPDGNIVLVTTQSGAVIVDREGRRLQVLDRQRGLRDLPSNNIYFPFVDRDGGLWLGSGGIVRVETPSPVSYFDTSDGVVGGVQRMHRHDGRLYAASGSGVFELHPASATVPATFAQLPGMGDQAWGFATMPAPAGGGPGTLLVAASTGLFKVDDGRMVAVKAPPDGSIRVSVLLPSTVDPTRVWAGMFDGLTSFRLVDGVWMDEGRVPGVTEQVRTLYEQPDGSLWAGTQATGVLRVRWAERPAPAPAERPAAIIDRFGDADGISSGFVSVQQVDGTPYFGAVTGTLAVYRYDDASRRFERAVEFDGIGTDMRNVGFGLQQGSDGVVYVNFGKETVVMRRQPDGTWSRDVAAFARFREFGSASSLLAEADGTVWMPVGLQIIRLDSRRGSLMATPPTPIIRRITVNRDRLLYGGITTSADVPRLTANDNALRLEFAAPQFPGEKAMEFQTRLDGLDSDWSAWTEEARRDYTNLGFGEFTFRVRARNLAGEVSDEGVYAFTILPPWYRTWWAYAGYLLAAGLVAFGADRVQRRRVIGKERERAQFAEARLRAESAEALARSESDGKKNIELLSDIGREITASLDFDTIFDKLYERVNQLADADVFGVGLYHPERQEIEYQLAIEQGKRYAPYSRSTADPDQLPVWCITHRQPVFINDVHNEYLKYVSRFDEQSRPLEDGSMSKAPQSVIYLPLEAKDRVLGIITIQSFETNAYTEHHLSMMRSLASYTAIALDNAAAYRQINEQEHENRRLFEDAQRARAVAEEADQAKSAFLSTVSHELRTPLTSVLGFAKIIKKRLDDRIFPLVPKDDKKIVATIQQVEDNLKVVVSEGERLTKLIDDVLDLAKIEAGKLEWHMAPVSLAEVIDRATAATSSLFEQKGLRLITDVTSGLPVVTGDSDRLIQVVINLISNAVKFTDAGSVTCRAVRRGGEIVVSIVDTGMGIAPVDQPKVFERFKQVGDTLTDKPKGTGLGLPICREIVEHHGGRVWVESELGTGSVFSFSIPVPDAQVSTPGAGGTPVELAALIRQLRDQVVVTTPRTAERAPRLLVVDDDPNIRELLTQELTEAGYLVRVATNGREALVEVRRERPDLVVLDVMMPEMNGFDVAAVLKNDPLTMDIPIVILSIVQDRERGIRIGVDRYLTKPIDTDLLFREVGALIEQRKSHRHVLVVDEDASTVKTLADVLTSRGYSVSEARDANLVEKALALKPDIILLNSVLSAQSENVRMLRFEKGMDHVLFLVYQ